MRARGFVVPALTIVTAFVVGLGTGVRVAKNRARAPFVAFERFGTLGAMLEQDPARRERTAAAYLDPAKAARELASYAWTVPNDPATSLGSVPRPGKWATATIDRRGMRTKRELRAPKPEGTFRAFVIGGSGAFGSGAPSDETTVAGFLEPLLARELAPRDVEVFTFANPGWTSTQERIAVENRLAALEPDLVIALTGTNDATLGRDGKDALAARTYGEEPFFAAIEAARGNAYAEEAKGPPLAPEAVARTLVSNASLAAAAIPSARYVVALQPMLGVGTKPLTDRERALAAAWTRVDPIYRARVDDEVRTIARGRDRVLLVDLSDVFRGETSEVWLDAYHVGDRGNRLLAEAIARALAGAALTASDGSRRR